MSTVFDVIGLIFDIFQKFFSFIGQLWTIITSFQDLVDSLLFGCPPVFTGFFTLFISISVLLFLWRLIP